jgi:peptide/nickel transport system substrate-binding protein
MQWFVVMLVASMSSLACAQTYQQSPVLDEQTRTKALPPVHERLPDEPVVVQPVRSIGRYGGTWRQLAMRPGDTSLATRYGYEPLLRWNRQGTQVMPGIAERWSVNDDATVFTFHLRKGMRWSDGHPFTSEAFAFTHNHIERNEQLTPTYTQWKVLGDRLMEVETPDPYTVVIRFAESYGQFPQMLCYRGLQRWLFAPAHYLKQFHPAFADQRRLDRDAQEKGFVNWSAYFTFMNHLDNNPDLPSVAPFVIVRPFPAAVCLAVRNPYYWKVDPQGRQLPYIDEIAYASIFDSTVLNMRAMDGNVDYQERHINPGNYTLFMESRDKASDPANRYNVKLEQGTNVTAIYVNQYSRDEAIRPILQDRRFRIALSVAINREELIEMCFAGLVEPSNGVTTSYDPFYVDGIDRLHTQYDPELANRLLDEAGLKRATQDGYRTMPNGEPFRQILHVYPSEGGDTSDLWLLVSEYWREVGLQFIVKHEDARLSGMSARNGNRDFWAYASAGVHWELDGEWYAPMSTQSYFAPLYGLYFASDGKAGVKPPPQHQQLTDWMLEMKSTTSHQRRDELGRRLLREWAEQCYLIGVCRKPELFIISRRFRNVPDHIIQDYTLMAPGYMGIEQFWIDQTQEP